MSSGNGVSTWEFRETGFSERQFRILAVEKDSGRNITIKIFFSTPDKGLGMVAQEIDAAGKADRAARISWSRVSHGKSLINAPVYMWVWVTNRDMVPQPNFQEEQEARARSRAVMDDMLACLRQDEIWMTGCTMVALAHDASNPEEAVVKELERWVDKKQLAKIMARPEREIRARALGILGQAGGVPKSRTGRVE